MQETNTYCLEKEHATIEVTVKSTYEIKEVREQHPYGDGYAYECYDEIDNIEHEVIELICHTENGFDTEAKGEYAQTIFKRLSVDDQDEIITNIESELGQ